MDFSEAPALFVPESNDDSIDIYEDLEFGFSSNNETQVKAVSPGLKEGMDLFEEIVTEEQNNKTASYNELKLRYQAAQTQITELHRRLEQLEVQNTALSKNNNLLKMNISILLQTARQEVTRKDAEIMRLNQESINGPFHQPWNLRDQSGSNHRQQPASSEAPPSSSSSQPSARPRLYASNPPRSTVSSKNPDLSRSTVRTKDPDPSRSTVRTKDPDPSRSTVRTKDPEPSRSTVRTKDPEPSRSTVLTKTPDPSRSTVSTKNPDPPRSTVSTKTPDPSRSTVSTKNPDPPRSTVSTKNPDPARSTVSTKNPDPSQSTLPMKNSDPQRSTVSTKTPDPSQSTVSTKNPEPSRSTVPTKTPDPSRSTVSTKNPDPPQSTVSTKTPDPSQSIVPTKTPDPSRSTVSTKNPDPPRSTVSTKNPDPPQSTVSTKTPDPSQSIVPTKTPDPSRSTVSTKNPDPPRSTVSTKNPDPPQSTVSTKTPDPSRSTVLTKNPDPARSTVSTKNPDPSQSTVPMKNSDPQRSTVSTKTPDPSRSTVSTKNPGPARSIVSTKTPDPSQSTVSTKNPGPARSIVSTKTPDPSQSTVPTKTPDPPRFTVSTKNPDPPRATVSTKTPDPSRSTVSTKTPDPSRSTVSTKNPDPPRSTVPTKNPDPQRSTFPTKTPEPPWSAVSSKNKDPHRSIDPSKNPNQQSTVSSKNPDPQQSSVPTKNLGPPRSTVKSKELDPSQSTVSSKNSDHPHSTVPKKNLDTLQSTVPTKNVEPPLLTVPSNNSDSSQSKNLDPPQTTVPQKNPDPQQSTVPLKDPDPQSTVPTKNLEPPQSTVPRVPSKNYLPLETSAPPPPSTKEPPPLPPAPPCPPPPPPPLPLSPLREDLTLTRDADHKNPTRTSQKDRRTSDKHSHHSSKHKEKRHRRDLERKDNASVHNSDKPERSHSSDRHERRHSHKDQVSNIVDSKNKSKKSPVLAPESHQGEGYEAKGGQSREDRRDRTRGSRSKSSDSKERKRHQNSSRMENRSQTDQPIKDRQLERREKGEVKGHRRGKGKHRSKEHSKKYSKLSEIMSKENNFAQKVFVENSPSRKLCFMETLNLTLSPVKKPELEGVQKELIPQELHQMDSSCPPSMERMCVIDEVNSSEPEAALMDCTEPSIETTPGKKNDESQKEAVICKTPENKLLEVNLVHSTPENKATEIHEDNFPTCINGLVAEKIPEAGKESNVAEEVFLPSQTEESYNVLSTSVSQVTEDVVSKPVEGQSKVQNVSPDKFLTSAPVPSCKLASKESEMVSSTINLETLPQEGLSLPEAIDLLTQNNTEDSAVSSSDCLEVFKVSSTTHDTAASDGFAERNKTPKKNFSPAKFVSGKCIRSPGSVPTFPDEDSMLKTLSSLKRIPDVISPLRSPVRISKRNLHHLQKPGHVKSLQKEFSNAPPDDASKKVDVNKENKQPGSPAKAAPVALAEPSEPELEEGEILSESEEAESPLPPAKRPKLPRPAKAKASPKCVRKRKTEGKGASDSPDFIQSPPNKSRFKTVCPAATKATFSSSDEVMDTFKLVRTEFRKKYMKLHKTFPKKSFYGVMENFQESFLEFVEGADFVQICSLTKELKSKLKRIIVSVFSKVLNNGIVKRIFEQQAVDLKQKLWDFVDVQVDYLFKDVHTALRSMCNPAKSPVEHRHSKGIDKRRIESPVKRKEQTPPSFSSAIVPLRTGLGSRGKGIRIALDKSDDSDNQSRPEPSTAISLAPKTPEKGNSSVVVSHNASAHDKTDYELLTEQQASSLTFNLVRDSQMGEIFKCLLQGSDLLDSATPAADQSTWIFNTPRKDGDRIITITTPGKFSSPAKLLSPNKFESPSRLITTWSSISPRKISSPNSKVLLNPAFFDESCLLEVPTENRAMQRPYSLLAEDLAVSLTIPSPLKSDSHLSFLQPPSVQLMSTPDSVLSAHISEDALLDEADAMEHDIHLALDTDNSSCGSSASVGSQGAPTQFLFKPDLPMQALVMERSNDHFIVKIRQASSANSTLTANDSLSETLTEDNEGQESESAMSSCSCIQNSLHTLVEFKAQMEDLSNHKHESDASTSQGSPNSIAQSKSGDKGSLPARTVTNPESRLSQASTSERDEAASESEPCLTIAEEFESTPEKTQAHKSGTNKKRKRNQGKSKAKRRRLDEDAAPRNNSEAAGDGALSPNSLSAKNVIRRKGEVVMAWTRDEDRTILLELKTKGASRETFSLLSEKLDKPSAKVAERFHQLMKLFKKQDK